MTTYYVGPGGADEDDGLSWATRKLTLTGAEDIPVAPADTVYVGPGTYRERLTTDVSGSSGSPITYIGDVSGINTDGIGGIVRLTGSDDDKTAVRSNCIYLYPGSSLPMDYRTFRGFVFDMASSWQIDTERFGFNGIIFEDCYFGPGSGIWLDTWSGLESDVFTIRRCIFRTTGKGIQIDTSGGLSNSLAVENCLFMTGNWAIEAHSHGATIKNCTFFGGGLVYPSVPTVIVCSGPPGSYTYVYNCLFISCGLECWGDTTDNITEDYNLYADAANLTPWDADNTQGANSYRVKNTPIEEIIIPNMYLSQYNHDFYIVSPKSYIRAYGCGQSPPSDDLYGKTRPAADSKKTPGAIQYFMPIRETTTVPSGATESMRFRDFMAFQIFVPITGKSMKFEVEVNREANYAGTLPQMVIKQPGQSDRITADTGAVSTWNKLADSFTPASNPTYVVMELRSNNTASAGSYNTFFGNPLVK